VNPKPAPAASNDRAADTNQESIMNRYETSIPRMSFGFAAIALSVATLGLTVMLPASLYSGRGDSGSLAASNAPVPTAIEVSIVPARIVVTGECEQNMAYEPARRAAPPSVDRSS
jgi:hypothetical protein